MGNEQKIELLKAHVASGTVSSNFATSLLSQWNKKGSLSEKQWYWVEKLVHDAENPAQPRVADVGSMSGVMALFSKAMASKLRRPKLTITPDTGPKVELSIAGARAKKPGSITVTDGGGYYNGVWYGRIVDGMFEASAKISDTALRDVTAILSDLSQDPMRVISRSGKTSGYCACCGRRLSDEDTKGRDGMSSVERGVGPVCAARWGLL